MSFWLCVDDNKLFGKGNLFEDSPCREKVDRHFEFIHGLKPMNQNIFDYMVVHILQAMHYGCGYYLVVGYEPDRPDNVSAIQAAIPALENEFNVEIVMKSDHWRGHSVYSRPCSSLQEAIDLFHLVLVEYSCPKLSDWINTTDYARYIDDLED